MMALCSIAPSSVVDVNVEDSDFSPADGAGAPPPPPPIAHGALERCVEVLGRQHRPRRASPRPVGRAIVDEELLPASLLPHSGQLSWSTLQVDLGRVLPPR
eukprot:CAMPEP_0175893838 /NCGR_PEP_ID=MMETSP0107_2-20121207/49678_1 /TAXON_ID=195067 ORGANISM="Goniomonas pacifica, Strain CCMP1869" /NCGR_SAMPLE_ID=MMETSP0107_2 /ASSEMBLY_ACC=CAM_ASM_000203 /LENGTH=100 /DNA_ID=CAMNT_0017214903 /DNA_START=447 /DNA_END=749 /DNA_ORIENTATION=-